MMHHQYAGFWGEKNASSRYNAHGVVFATKLSSYWESRNTAIDVSIYVELHHFVS